MQLHNISEMPSSLQSMPTVRQGILPASPEGLPAFHSVTVKDNLLVLTTGCPGTRSVAQAGLDLRDPLTSASCLLGLPVCKAAAGSLILCVLCVFFFHDPPISRILKSIVFLI